MMSPPIITQDPAFPSVGKKKKNKNDIGNQISHKGPIKSPRIRNTLVMTVSAFNIQEPIETHWSDVARQPSGTQATCLDAAYFAMYM